MMGWTHICAWSPSSATQDVHPAAAIPVYGEDVERRKVKLPA